MNSFGMVLQKSSMSFFAWISDLRDGSPLDLRLVKQGINISGY
jgi:hypothetical protein